ncbi:MAG: hypothetical protein J6A58_08090 [Oscillospiraceae bacterium]|nr:hypothetical protein [Oscillospiraceae bacterium]
MNDLNSLLMPEDVTDQFDAGEMKQNQGLAIATCILFFIPMVTKNNSDYLKFLSNQSLTLLVLSIVVFIVSKIVGIIPIIGGLVGKLLGLCVLALLAWLIIDTVTGKARKLPIIGHINIMDFFAK